MWTSQMQGSHLLNWEICHGQQLIHQLYIPVSEPNQSAMQLWITENWITWEQQLKSTRHALKWNTVHHRISKLPFTNADVWIMVGTSCRRATASKFCITERRKCSSYSGYQKWKSQCWSRMLPSNCPNKNIHPSTNRWSNTWEITQAPWSTPQLMRHYI